MCFDNQTLQFHETKRHVNIESDVVVIYLMVEQQLI